MEVELIPFIFYLALASYDCSFLVDLKVCCTVLLATDIEIFLAEIPESLKMNDVKIGCLDDAYLIR